MLKIANYTMKEASRVYGDLAEKVAFDVNIDPVSIISAFTGGYAANRTFDKIQDKKNQELAKQKTLENDYYSQIESILSNLKIVFTPINVIFNVNGQVFEIIRADEMTPHMKNAFLNKDAAYFRDILVNKMSMEMQLAEQAFAKRLLAMNGQSKQAGFLDSQEFILGLEESEFNSFEKVAFEGVSGNLSLPVSFDSLRPFEQSEDFFNPSVFQKVAGLFDYFKRDQVDELKLKDMKKDIQVGFLPDRVLFLHQGQLVEQLSLLNMNEEGYEAFRKRDKEFFLDFFVNKSKEIAQSITAEPTVEKQASEEETEKAAASLEDVLEDVDFDPLERSEFKLFEDNDIHPVAYSKILADRYGVNWGRHELEALLKQIEVDFNLEKGINDIPLNKVACIHSLAAPEHTMFMTSFTFEKFARTMNNKDVRFNEFESNLTFSEIMFAMEMARTFNGDDVFLEFHQLVIEYISEELFLDGIRFVSDQIYDETDPEELDFYKRVNGLLMRKWKEYDANGLTAGSEREQRKRVTELIVYLSDTILKNYADEIDLHRMYDSARNILNNYKMLSAVPESDTTMVRNLVVDGVVRHIQTAVFLEAKEAELAQTLANLEGSGVK